MEALLQGPITQALDAIAVGTPGARERLFDLVKLELDAIAHRFLARESPGKGLQTTMLVDDAFLRLLGNAEVSFENRRHFFGAAAEAVRRLLIDHARTMSAAKRGGRMNHGRGAVIDLESLPGRETEEDDWTSLSEALVRFEDKDARACEVVRLRFFAGLGEKQAAEVLGVTERTVRRDWVYAKAWLAAELQADQSRGAIGESHST